MASPYLPDVTFVPAPTAAMSIAYTPTAAAGDGIYVRSTPESCNGSTGGLGVTCRAKQLNMDQAPAPSLLSSPRQKCPASPHPLPSRPAPIRTEK